jgi:hypothetical protein
MNFVPEFIDNRDGKTLAEALARLWAAVSQEEWPRLAPDPPNWRLQRLSFPQRDLRTSHLTLKARNEFG